MSTVNILSKTDSPAKTKVSWNDPLAVTKLYWEIAARLNKAGISKNHDKVVLCIGTDRSTGDSLGPLVGSKIQAAAGSNIHVYGTLEDPVHASNLSEKLEQIYARFKDPYVIAVDASLGSVENVGNVNIADGSLLPGAGVHKDLPAVGNISITGIVNVGGFMEFLVLQNTRLNIVMKMADLIAEALKKIDSLYAY